MSNAEKSAKKFLNVWDSRSTLEVQAAVGEVMGQGLTWDHLFEPQIVTQTLGDPFLPDFPSADFETAFAVLIASRRSQILCVPGHQRLLMAEDNHKSFKEVAWSGRLEDLTRDPHTLPFSRCKSSPLFRHLKYSNAERSALDFMTVSGLQAFLKAGDSCGSLKEMPGQILTRDFPRGFETAAKSRKISPTFKSKKSDFAV